MVQYIRSLFNLDALTWVMLSLVLFIGFSIFSFSSRYMRGDSRYKLFFVQLSLLILCTLLIVTADHLLVFFIGWCGANFLLTCLMRHKAAWKAAKSSALLALKNYAISSACLGVGFLLFYWAKGESSIQEIARSGVNSSGMLLGLLLLLVAAMAQSALWPFHRWLISSLNSPTPVSALMHAGLVNGGGFLLIRFSPLLLENGYLLNAIFLVGICSALLGTLWKLMQSDVKRMLACSTMGQMGFMLAQCGLGLFAAAVTHIVMHGLFKAYLFLASGSVAQEKRHPSTLMRRSDLFYALFCGLLGALSFAFSSHKLQFSADSSWVLLLVIFITATQSAISILSMPVSFRLTLALAGTVILSVFYGMILRLISYAFHLEGMTTAIPLNGLHYLAMGVLLLSWILFNLLHKQIGFVNHWMKKGYVEALNASQPHPETVTSHRNEYQYL